MQRRPDLEAILFDANVAFDDKVLQVFRFQAAHNPVYHRFCESLGIQPDSVTRWQDIPLLPVSSFKYADVWIDFEAPNARVFRSSATGGLRSTHYVANPELYWKSVLAGFKAQYGNGPFRIWSYLPGYTENPDSSLIAMVEILRSELGSEQSGALQLGVPIWENIAFRESADHPILLIGAAFGLLDLIDFGVEKPLPEGSIIIETGGMKTHRRERTRTELHRELSQGFGVPLRQVHSEYGMAELLSQAYSIGGEWFTTPEWMKIVVRDASLPLTHSEIDSIAHGQIGIIDLANLYSCSFLLTGDRGSVKPDGTFQIHGRMDPSDLRGCNFLLERD